MKALFSKKREPEAAGNLELQQEKPVDGVLPLRHERESLRKSIRVTRVENALTHWKTEKSEAEKDLQVFADEILTKILSGAPLLRGRFREKK